MNVWELPLHKVELARPRTPADLFNELKYRFNIDTDAELARWIGIDSSYLQKIRIGQFALGNTVLLDIHIASDMPIRELKLLSGLLVAIPRKHI
jgi:hypothetical protein